MTGAFDLNADVVGFLLAAGLTPAVGEQRLEHAVGVLSQIVGARHLDVEAQMPDFLVITHRPHSVAAGPIFAHA